MITDVESPPPFSRTSPVAEFVDVRVVIVVVVLTTHVPFAVAEAEVSLWPLGHLGCSLHLYPSSDSLLQVPVRYWPEGQLLLLHVVHTPSLEAVAPFRNSLPSSAHMCRLCVMHDVSLCPVATANPSTQEAVARHCQNISRPTFSVAHRPRKRILWQPRVLQRFRM